MKGKQSKSRVQCFLDSGAERHLNITNTKSFYPIQYKQQQSTVGFFSLLPGREIGKKIPFGSHRQAEDRLESCPKSGGMALLDLSGYCPVEPSFPVHTGPSGMLTGNICGWECLRICPCQQGTEEAQTQAHSITLAAPCGAEASGRVFPIRKEHRAVEIGSNNNIWLL